MSRSQLRSALLLVVLIGPTAPLLGGALVGAALADAATNTIPDCRLTGTATDMTEDCRALRVTLQDEVDDCMQAKEAKADALPGAVYTHNAHTNRSRLLLCDLEVRQRMGLAD